MNTIAKQPDSDFQSWAQQLGFPTTRLNLVSVQDAQNLREALRRGYIPADLEAKLIKLAAGNLLHRSIEQHCRTIIALLQATWDGSFKQATPAECDRLLRVLAYVRLDEDAMADYRPDGFKDDHQEMKAAALSLSDLLQAFKCWRLRNQVPAMWGKV